MKGKILAVSLLNRLEASYEALSEKRMKPEKFLKALEDEVANCSSMDEIDTLMFYSMREDLPGGIETCERIADAGVKGKAAGKLSSDSAESFQFKTVAEHFVAFGKANSKEAFFKFFDLAVSHAKSCLDFEILVSTLTDACRNAEGVMIDPDFIKTRALLEKTLVLAVEEKKKLTLETLAYIAENDLGDKSLAKEIKGAMKKIK